MNSPSENPESPAAPGESRGRRLRKPAMAALGLIAALLAGWWLAHRPNGNGVLELFGNVDLREVSLAFNDSGRIASLSVQEGDRVRRGQVLGQLDTRRIEPELAQAEAAAAAQRAVVARMHHGSRPQEIAEARAELALAQAQALQARAHYERIASVFHASGGRAVSRQDLTDARAGQDVALARVSADREALQLAILGPRHEDVAQAEALLAGDRAQVALLKEKLADAQLRASVAAVVRSRVAEPGDMTSPEKTVFTLAITDPKWVRAYIPESDLGWVRPGMPATVAVDAFPHRRFAGWVGFISSEAEFTPKTIETEQLRTSLVYEVRVFVRDPNDELRLGMPATVYLTPGGGRK